MKPRSTAGPRSSLGVLLGALLAASALLAESVLKENLDLPADAVGYDLDEHDAFFFVVARGGTMQNSGELQRAKQEVIHSIREFAEETEFGVFFYDAGVVKFPGSGQPAEASPAMKASGISFVSSTPGGGGTCPQAALLAALHMSQRSTARTKVIVFLSDGGATCSGAAQDQYKAETLAAVAKANHQHAVIHTIGVLDVVDEEFLRALAASNGGTFTKIERVTIR